MENLEQKLHMIRPFPKKEIENLALSLSIIKNYLNGKEPKRIIVVPERIVSIVI